MSRFLAAAAIALALLPSVARADVVLVFSDAERAALISALGAALQGSPQISQQAVYLLNKINTAPTMTGQKVVKPDKPETPEPDKTNEPKDKTP